MKTSLATFCAGFVDDRHNCQLFKMNWRDVLEQAALEETCYVYYSECVNVNMCKLEIQFFPSDFLAIFVPRNILVENFLG